MTSGIRSAASLSYQVPVLLLRYGSRIAANVPTPAKLQACTSAGYSTVYRIRQSAFHSGHKDPPIQTVFHAQWFSFHSWTVDTAPRRHSCVSSPSTSPVRAVSNLSAQSESQEDTHSTIDSGSDGNLHLKGGRHGNNLKGDGFVRGDRLRWRKNPQKVQQLRFAKHITNLVRKGKLEEAEEVLGHMRGKGVKPEAAVFNTLLAGLGRRGDAAHAFKIFNNMKKWGVLPTEHTYTSLFTACAQAGPKSLDQLTRIRAETERRDVLLNNIATNALITALASCEQPTQAYQVYLDMLKLNLSPDIQTFGSLLLAAAKDSESGVDLAQRIWSEMLASGFQPDLYCYNLLLQCLRDAGVPSTRQPAKAGEKTVSKTTGKDLIGNQKRNRTSSDSAKGNGENKSSDAVRSVEAKWQVQFCLSPSLSITLCLGGGGLRWVGDEDVGRLLGAMEEDGLKPDIRTFHLLASLTLDCGSLLEEMRGRGVAPDNRFMVAAIRMQAQLGGSAKALLQAAEERGLQLGQLGYQAMATGCTSQRQGVGLLEEMKALGMRPNEYVFGTLMGNAARLKKYEYLTALMKKMRHLEVFPNRTISDILHKVASEPPTRSHLKTRHNGFRGYYELWRRTMSAEYSDSRSQ